MPRSNGYPAGGPARHRSTARHSSGELVRKLAVGPGDEFEPNSRRRWRLELVTTELDARVTGGGAVFRGDRGLRRVPDILGDREAANLAGAGAIVGQVVDRVDQPLNLHVAADVDRSVHDEP